MTNLSRDARALIHAARGADDPSRAEQQQVALAFREALARPMRPATLGPRRYLRSAKWAMGTVLASGALAAAVQQGVLRSALTQQVPPAPSVVVSVPPQAQRAQLPRRRVLAAPTAAPPTASVPTMAVPLATQPASTSLHRPVKLSARLTEELVFIAQARDALAVHDYARALALTAQHAERHPTGILREEREAIRALAHCRGQGDSGPAQRFLAQRHRSVFAARIARDCGLVPISVPAGPSAGTQGSGPGAGS